MNILLNIIALSSLSFLYIEFTSINLLIKELFNIKGRIKPLDCIPCLSFWVAIIFCIVTQNKDWFIICSITPVVGYLFQKI